MEKIKKEHIYIPIFLIVSIMPLIIYGKIDILDYLTYMNWDGSKAEIDFFSFYKICFSILMSFLLCILYIKNKKKFKIIEETKEYKYIFILTTFVIISFLISEYKSISLFGFLFRYEGILAIIAYITILYISINIFDNDKSIERLLYCLMFSYFIIALIGIMQYFGFDIFNSLRFQKMIIPQKHEYLVGKLKLFARKNEVVSSTIGNSNYVGYYYAITMPIFFILFLISNIRKQKFIYLIATILGVVMLIITSSETGLIAAFLSILVFFISYWKNFKINKKRNILISMMILSSILAINYFNKGTVYEKVDKFKYKFIYENTISEDKNLLQDIIFKENELSLKYKDKLLNLKYSNNKLSFLDDKNEKLYLAQNVGERKGTFYITDSRYNDLSVVFTELGQNNIKAILLEISENVDISITIENGVFKYINNAGKIIDPNEKVKVLFGEGKEELLTSRIYIWSRAIPKILEKPLFGYGPDTFEIVFPNNDYIGLYKAYNTTNMIVDKPHNTYIQVATNMGILSLISITLLLIVYFKRYIKFLKDKTNSKNGKYYYAMTSSIISYLIAAIMYDSTVVITPILCIILGIGIRLGIENNNLEE